MKQLMVGLLVMIWALELFAQPWAFDETEVFQGGEMSTRVFTGKAFSQFPRQLGFIEQGNFKRGDFLFRGKHEHQGPLFNASTCQTCHVHDGRGNTPGGNKPMVAMLLRLSVPGMDTRAGVLPDPVYGDQLQPFGINDDKLSGRLSRPEGDPDGDAAVGEGFPYIEYEIITGEFPDGRAYPLVSNRYPDSKDYFLRQPVYKVKDLAYGSLHSQVMFSPRVASPVFGLGLLEAIPEAAILANADPDDADGDGISGRPNIVWDVLANQPAVGRFGLKANQPGILQQLAAAFHGDIGITSVLFPDELCSPVQPACLRQAAVGKTATVPDATPVTLALIEFYIRTLAVPQRRNADSKMILHGKKIFYQIGCTGCHVPRYRTGELSGSVLGQINGQTLTPGPKPLAMASNQTIWPYTDLLLHDMGGACQPVSKEAPDGGLCEEEQSCAWVRRCTGLADGRPDFQASGREWRTPPLWGIGLTQTVNPKAGFLHDGRARTLVEAILWHGGEAVTARENYRNLPGAERSALIWFLKSL
jgi:CxxC motif-containing protein (DUF1111 family)